VIEISSFHVNKVHFEPIFARKKFLVILVLSKCTFEKFLVFT